MHQQLQLMSPFDLGETKTKEALPHLIVYLRNGSDNDKRLAASALTKLIQAGVSCKSSIPFLVKNTSNEKPQIRQYTFKALLEFELSVDFYKTFLSLYRNEEKDYNKKIIRTILERFECFNEFDIRNFKEEPVEKNESPVKLAEPQIEKGYIYFIQEDYAGRVKIGKTVNLDQRIENFGVKLPFNIELIHSVQSNNHHYTEKLFHVHFNDKRANGEWFDLNDDDIAWIKSGCYTKRLIDSINYTDRKQPYRKSFTSITTKQATFLSSLLGDKGFILTKPINKLSAEEAGALIAHLYKGEYVSENIVSLLDSNVS